MGEHAVVYGKPALLAAINLKCKAIITPRSDKEIELVSNQLNFQEKTSLQEIISFTEAAQKLWGGFKETNSAAVLKKITPQDTDLAKIAIGETLLKLNLKSATGFSLLVDSKIPVGVGLGSSAAVAVSIIKALTKFLSLRLKRKEVNEIAYETEKRMHGFPSGGDNTTVTYGGLLWFRKETEFLKIIQPIENIKSEILKNFVLINTGRPKVSTGEMVSLIRERYKEKLTETEAIFNRIEVLTKDLLYALKDNNPESFIGITNECEVKLEELGVVTDFAQKITKEIKNLGGAAKISGAGGNIGKEAGIILALHQEPQKLIEVAKKYHLPYYKVRLGVEGLR